MDEVDEKTILNYLVFVRQIVQGKMFPLTGDFFAFVPYYASSLSGKMFAWKILLSRIFCFFLTLLF